MKPLKPSWITRTGVPAVMPVVIRKGSPGEALEPRGQ